jgi:hypothetical protein
MEDNKMATKDNWRLVFQDKLLRSKFYLRMHHTHMYNLVKKMIRRSNRESRRLKTAESELTGT